MIGKLITNIQFDTLVDIKNIDTQRTSADILLSKVDNVSPQGNAKTTQTNNVQTATS